MPRILHAAPAVALLLSLSAPLTPPVAAQASAAQTPESQPAEATLQLGAEALADIAALVEEKRGRSRTEQKIDSNLLIEHKRRQGDARLSGLRSFRSAAQIAADGSVLVDLEGRITAELEAHIAESLGGRVVNAHPRWGALRARLPLANLLRLARREDVRSIRPADLMITQMVNTSEGDVAHGTDMARTDFGVDGSGLTACAMSDSVDALAAVQATGDLPPGVTVLPGQSGNPGTSEGTALLEILHDLAPGADLAFATAVGGQAQMAQNILDLAAFGCDAIVDDVLYLAEPVFQDGIIAQAVDQVSDQGVFYATSAGNSGNLASGNSGVHESDYLATALPAPLGTAGLSAHDFGGGANSTGVTADPPAIVTLQWSDPQDGAANDYDLFLLDAALANVLKASTNTQNGTQDPLEFLDSSVDDDTGNRLVVVKFDGEDRFFHLNTHRGRLENGTDGQIFGHPAALGALTIAAVNVATAGGGLFTGGAANPVQDFSSDGPRRIFFETDGAPVARSGGAPALRGGQPSEIRRKPDVAAADGVSTATPGFNPFFGTSASAPHSAAISVLFKELFPGIVSTDSLNNLFKSTALDIEDPGFDNQSGNGIMMTEESFNSPIFADGFESGNTSSWQ
ncbi:MAG: S8 family serine peptidase [Acidobacteriota bacterium]